MKELISISDFGSIRILGIPLGHSIDGIKSVITDFEIKEYPKCLSINNVVFNKLPGLNITFSKDTDCRVNEIRIQNTGLSQKECDIVYDYFKRNLNELNVITENTDNTHTILELSNLLHQVHIVKQTGLGDNENKYPLIITINGRLLDGDFLHLHTNEDKKKAAIRELYYTTSQRQHKPHTCMSISQMMKVLFLILTLIVAYLFALNGRYAPVGEMGAFMDKWTKTLVVPDDDGKYEKY